MQQLGGLFFAHPHAYQGCENKPSSFLGQMLYKATKPGFSFYIMVWASCCSKSPEYPVYSPGGATLFDYVVVYNGSKSCTGR